MECKNCQLTLTETQNFCGDCGAKVIRYRLTFKNLSHEFTERFLNIDNTFFRTFWHLFTKPEAVIVGYVNGVRRKYLNPISYFTIAVTLGGLFLFLNKQFFPDALNFQFDSVDVNTLDDKGKFSRGIGLKFQNYLRDYQNIFYIAMLPFLTLISRLVFINKKEFNLSEHFIMNIYGYSQMSICINTIYILLIWNSQFLYYASMATGIFQILYFSYIFKKIFKLSKYQIVIKLLFFLALFAILFVAIIIVIALYLAIFTDTFQKIAP